MKFIAVIPARGGSKGVPGKNMRILAGKPLIFYTISAAQGSKYIDKVVVSTDSEEILDYSESLSAGTVLRPPFLAEDTTPTAPVIYHLIEEMSAEIKDEDMIVLLQPTSPLRDSKLIDKSIENLMSCGAKGLISVKSPVEEPYKALVDKGDGLLRGLVSDEAPFMRRQDCPKTYYANGAIYIFNVKNFIDTKEIGLNNTVPFYMNKTESLDIDTLDDFIEAERVLADEKTRV